MSVNFQPVPTSLAWGRFRTVTQGATDAHIKPSYDLNIPARTGIVQDGANFKVASLTVTVSIHAPGTWVVAGRQSTSLLDHERLHWMMAIIVGYELERAVLALRSPSVTLLTQQVRSTFTRYRERREPGLQRQYDNDTNHGATASAQDRWRSNVTSWYSNRATRDIPLTTP